MAFSGVDTAMNTCDKMKQYVSTGIESTMDIVFDHMEHLKTISENDANELKDVMCDYAQMELEIKQFDEAVSFVKDKAKNFEATKDCPDLSVLLDHRLGEIKERDKDIDVKDHTKYQELIQRIEGSSLGASNELDEDDIQLTEQEINTKCPITRLEMVHPVINKICKHHYDRAGISTLMKQRGNKAKCPVVGCGNRETVTKDHLQEDKEMKRHIDRKNRQADVKK